MYALLLMIPVLHHSIYRYEHIACHTTITPRGVVYEVMQRLFRQQKCQDSEHSGSLRLIIVMIMVMVMVLQTETKVYTLVFFLIASAEDRTAQQSSDGSIAGPRHKSEVHAPPPRNSNHTCLSCSTMLCSFGIETHGHKEGNCDKGRSKPRCTVFSCPLVWSGIVSNSTIGRHKDVLAIVCNLQEQIKETRPRES